MSPKQWLALLTFYISYLFFGASIFYHMEHRLETERRSHALQSRTEINELLTIYAAPNDPEIQRDIFDRLNDYCEKPVTNYTEDKYVDPYVWTFFHSFFFSFTVCSTVGYGNISPNNTTGRMFMIFYALIGIPVNGILFAYLGEFFGKTFVGLYRRYKQFKLSTNKNYVPRELGLVAQIALYLTPGVVIFIFFPATLFTIYEDWPYSISVYYAFVTLTTIGFGDYVVSFQPHQEREFGIYFIMYQIFIIFWVIFGLGYLVMIMGFIARGLRSKRVIKLEHALAVSIKQTQSKIWNGMTKDIGYLRRVLNEIYLLKFKPVYHEPGDMVYNIIPRSESCPDLLLYRSDSPIPPRRRAFSECFDVDVKQPRSMSVATLNRVQSDSDLSRINRKKTFEGVNSLVQPGELLAKVVTALGNMRPNDEDGQSVLEMATGSKSGSGGIHGFSDSQILESERTWSGWSLPSSDKSYITAPAKFRDRATSECRIPPIHERTQDPNEWTWSGSNTQIKELMKMRQRQNRKTQDLYRASFGHDKLDSTIQIPVDIPQSATNKTLLSRLNPFKRRSASIDVRCNPISDNEFTAQNYLDATSKGRKSKISLQRQYMTQTQNGRQSIYSLSPQAEEVEQSLLETTTIADLIRAIELVHTNAHAPDSSSASDISGAIRPRRKMGTASLTPPKVPSLLTLFPQNFETLPPPNSNSLDRRRGSLRPTIYSSIRHNPIALARRQSSAVLPRTELPPPYTVNETPPLLQRRFSVRPSALTIPPGQAPRPLQPATGPSSTTPSAQVSSALQRKLSLRPSPLTRLNSQQSSARNILWRPNQLLRDNIAGSRTRHGSLSNLYEKNIRNRTESK